MASTCANFRNAHRWRCGRARDCRTLNDISTWSPKSIEPMDSGNHGEKDSITGRRSEERKYAVAYESWSVEKWYHATSRMMVQWFCTDPMAGGNHKQWCQGERLLSIGLLNRKDEHTPVTEMAPSSGWDSTKGPTHCDLEPSHCASANLSRKYTPRKCGTRLRKCANSVKHHKVENKSAEARWNSNK